MLQEKCDTMVENIYNFTSFPVFFPKINLFYIFIPFATESSPCSFMVKYVKYYKRDFSYQLILTQPSKTH